MAFEYRIEEEIATVCETDSGWTLEINKVSFGNHPAKYDIRAWSPGHEKMGKGLRLTEDEIRQLGKTIFKLNI